MESQSSTNGNCNCECHHGKSQVGDYWETNSNHSVQFCNLFRIVRLNWSKTIFLTSLDMVFASLTHPHTQCLFAAVARYEIGNGQFHFIFGYFGSIHVRVFFQHISVHRVFSVMMPYYVKKSRTKHIYPYGYNLAYAFLVLLVVLFSKRFKWQQQQQQWSICIMLA